MNLTESSQAIIWFSICMLQMIILRINVGLVILQKKKNPET